MINSHLGANYSGKNKNHTRKQKTIWLTRYSRWRLQVLHFYCIGFTKQPVSAGTRWTHAHTVWVVCSQKRSSHTILQQRRENEHWVPPLIWNFSNSLERITENESGEGNHTFGFIIFLSNLLQLSNCQVVKAHSWVLETNELIYKIYLI